MDKKIRNILIGIAGLSIIILLLVLFTDTDSTYIALTIIIALMAGRGIFAVYQFEKTTDIIIEEKNKAMKLIENPSDSSWEYKGLSERVELCFDKVNEALEMQEIDITKGYVTRKMYENLKIKIEEDTLEERRVEIVRTLPIKAIDRIGDNRDLIEIAVEYIIEKDVDGERDITTVEEIWTFVKGNGQWMVNNISEFKIGMSIGKLEKS